MARNLIYQYYYDFHGSDSHIDVGYKYYMLSKQSIEAYANKVGAEYVFIDKPIDVPFYGVFLPFQEGWYKDYDNICHIDCDFLATNKAKNVFDFTPDNAISINFMTTDRGLKYREMMPKMRERGHANSGIVNFPKAINDQFAEYVNTELESYNANKHKDIRIKDMGDFDQAFINLFIGRTGLYQPLSDEFNWHMSRQEHRLRWHQSLIHYHRRHKNLMKEDFPDDRILK